MEYRFDIHSAPIVDFDQVWHLPTALQLMTSTEFVRKRIHEQEVYIRQCKKNLRASMEVDVINRRIELADSAKERLDYFHALLKYLEDPKRKTLVAAAEDKLI